MSSKIKIVDKSYLLKTLEELGYSVEEDSLIRGYNERERIGEIVIKIHGGFDVGFIKAQDSTYQIVANWEGVESTMGKDRKLLEKEIRREYTVVKTIHEQKEKGYVLKSRWKNEEGEDELRFVHHEWTL